MTEHTKQRTDQFKAITDSYVNLNAEYREKIKMLEQRVKELEAMQGTKVSQEEFESVLFRELEYHRELIECAKMEKDLKEEIIFLKLELSLLKKNKT